MIESRNELKKLRRIGKLEEAKNHPEISAVIGTATTHVPPLVR